MGMKLLFIQYPKCGTCKKAKKWLEENQLAFTDRDIVLHNPSFEELKEWYERSKLPLKRFFNTSGLVYKELNLKDQLPNMSEEEQLKLLATNGKLIKRPMLISEQGVLLGFKENDYAIFTK